MKRNNGTRKNKSYIANEKKINQNFNYDSYNENGDNSEYEISSTYRNNVSPSPPQNNSMNKETYIDHLESKIQQQAKQISELNKYKYLCEKRIKQLNPNEILPLTLESLNNDNNLYNINNNINNNRNNINKDMNKKYQQLNEKFQKLQNDYNEIIRNNNMNDVSSTTINLGNINDKYKMLKEKYKRIKDENKKIIEVLKEETKACEMQKNIIDVLQQAIENDICKNNDLKKYITIDNIVDFTQLKLESEQYRKELVLSQALVNSLKSEIEQLHKEKEEAKNNVNMPNRNNIERIMEFNNINDNLNEEEINNNNKNKNNYYNNNDYNKNNQEENNLIMSENISLKEALNKQAQLVKELMDENQNLKKLVDEATIKLNDVINNKNENKINNEQLNYQLNSKINEIKQYEDKFSYFNDYISVIKSIFMNFQENLPKFINIYNKMANEDLNSLLSNSFSQSIIQLSSRVNQLNKIEKFNLETNIETDITNIIIELLQILNNEFISIYEKVFQTNCYYKEANKKIEELKLQIKDNENVNQNNLKKINDINELLDNEKKNIDECKNVADEYKLQLSICQLEKDNLNKKIESYKDDRNSIINCYYIIIKALTQYNEKLSQLLRECVNIIETKAKLYNEKEIIMEQFTKNRIKDLNRDEIYQNNPEINKMVTQEQITLQNLINEFENKINEKEHQLAINKDKIKQCLLELQSKPLIQKDNLNNNNGINNNYNYYLAQDNNNGNKNISEGINYNANNKNKVNEIKNNSKKKLSLQSLETYKDDNYNKKLGNNNGTTYTYSSNPYNQYGQQININDVETQNYYQ